MKKDKVLRLTLALFLASILTLRPATAFAVEPDTPTPAGPNRAFTGDDLFRLAGATDPQISPDESRFAYVRMTMGPTH